MPVDPARRVTFVGGASGEWRVERIGAVRGDPLAGVPCLRRVEGEAFEPASGAAWMLHGVRSHERYVERAERARLVAVQQDLGRPEATRAALIPIKKTEAWWQLPQDERRALFEARSRHIAVGLEYLPEIARRLYHCRDLLGPFDFLTWFEFAPEHAARFDELVDRLRRTEEWRYVAREVDVRLAR